MARQLTSRRDIIIVRQWIRQSIDSKTEQAKSEARDYLIAEKEDPVYPLVLLLIVQHEKTKERIRIAAAQEFTKLSRNGKILTFHRNLVKSELLKCLKSPETVRRELIEAFSCIASDCLDEWPPLLEVITENLRSRDYSICDYYLKVANSLFKKYRYSREKQVDSTDFVLKFARALTKLFEHVVTSVVEKDWKVSSLIYKSILMMCKLFFSLTLHNVIENDNLSLKKWTWCFHLLLKDKTFGAISPQDHKENHLDQIRAQVYANLALCIKKREFYHNHVEESIHHISSLVTPSNMQKCSDSLIRSIMKFLIAVFESKSCRSICATSEVYMGNCKELIFWTLKHNENDSSAGVAIASPMTPLFSPNGTSEIKRTAKDLAITLMKHFNDIARDALPHFLEIVEYFIANRNEVDQTSASNCHIQKLSTEIIDYILRYGHVSISDVLNFSLTCTQFYNVTKSKVLWRAIFQTRLPTLWETLVEDRERMLNGPLKIVANNLKIRSQLLDVLKTLTDASRNNAKTTKQEVVTAFLGNTATASHLCIMIDELIFILNDETEDLTRKYYARSILRYLKEEYVMYKLGLLLFQTAKNQRPEQIAVLVAEWLQPEETKLSTKISQMLDKISSEAKDWLKNTNCWHSIFRFTDDTTDLNQFSFDETKQILQSINDVMFHASGFALLGKLTYDSYKESINLTEGVCLNKVLESKKGDLLSLVIIFESIARRLGVQCEIHQSPNDTKSTVPFYLQWKKYFEETIVASCNVFFDYDASRRGSLDLRTEPTTDNDEKEKLSIKAIARSLTNRVHNQHIPCCFTTKSLNANNVKKSIMQASSEGLYKSIEQVVPHSGHKFHIWFRRFPQFYGEFFKERNIVIDDAKFKYSLGQILCYQRRKQMDDKCHDSTCQRRRTKIATYCVIAELSGVNTDHSYFILCDGGICMTAREDQLFPIISESESVIIDHPLIGKYFSSFDGMRYKPNVQLMNKYIYR